LHATNPRKTLASSQNLRGRGQGVEKKGRKERKTEGSAGANNDDSQKKRNISPRGKTRGLHFGSKCAQRKRVGRGENFLKIIRGKIPEGQKSTKQRKRRKIGRGSRIMLSR